MAWRPAKRTCFPMLCFRKSLGIISSLGTDDTLGTRQQFPVVLPMFNPVAVHGRRTFYRLLKKISEARRAFPVIVSVKRDREIYTNTTTNHEHELERGD